MSKKDELGNNKSDFLAAASRSTIGLIPFAGPLLGELVSSVIPNQRIDRLTKYIQELEKRISTLEPEKLENAKTDEETIDLIEEGFVQASRAFTNERRQYIASIVSNGLTKESIEASESKLLLKLLSELNDVEIIWLRSYLYPTIGGDEEFRSKHRNVLETIHAYIGSDEKALQKSDIQKSYKEHLERLGLIKGRVNMDHETNMPRFDRTTGKPEISYSSVTSLGRMLLQEIGLIED